MKKIFIQLSALMLVASIAPACAETNEGKVDEPETELEEPEEEPEEEVVVTERAKVLWIDAEANFYRLRNQSNIRTYLDKIVDAGFNTIVVDVKPVQGDVLYDSDFLPACTSLSGYTVDDRGFDYLQVFLDEAAARNLKVTVSATIMTMGLTSSQTGPAYEDDYWGALTATEYRAQGFTDIKETGTFAFLNPVLPDVHDYAIRMVTEIATKYTFDGFALDYCRFCDLYSDFSQESLEAFEAYSGLTVSNFPTDILYYNSAGEPCTGTLYPEWVEWRSSVIQGYVTDISAAIKAVNPDINIEYWAASWWPLPTTGQNWASPTLDNTSSYWWATADYYKTGFADQLDIFQLGAYLNNVYGLDDAESVEYAIDKAKRIINDDCTLYGTISCAVSSFDIEEAVYLCLKETAGVMVFDMSHVINNNKWDAIKAGIERADEYLEENNE